MIEDRSPELAGLDADGRLERLRGATEGLRRAIGRLVESAPEAMEGVEQEFRMAAAVLTPLAEWYQGLPADGPANAGFPEERAALVELRRAMAIASRLLHQAATVRFSLAAQLFDSPGTYSVAGAGRIQAAPGTITSVLRA
ncbi:MAG: hypothetical protein R2729_14850 [Bryobacteraceae bacterium]